jgi:hypothetical protein
LCYHRLQVLRRQRFLKQVDQIKLDCIEDDVAGYEQLVGFAKSKQLEGSHELLVLLRALAHCDELSALLWGENLLQAIDNK